MDHIVTNASSCHCEVQLCIFDDNEAVIMFKSAFVEYNDRQSTMCVQTQFSSVLQS